MVLVNNTLKKTSPLATQHSGKNNKSSKGCSECGVNEEFEKSRFGSISGEIGKQSPVWSQKGSVIGSSPSVKGSSGPGSSTPSPVAAGKGTKTVKKTQLAPPSAGYCGEYSWQVRFSVDNADASTNGYIVQKVDANYSRENCDGTNSPVPGIGTFPFWEAWGVRAGKVYVGDTNSPHNADTYTDPNMGELTRGSIAIVANAEFFPNVVLPAHMIANNPKTQAQSLRSTIVDPKLTGGTGSIPHNLTASWDCCGPLLPGPSPTKKTKFSNIK